MNRKQFGIKSLLVVVTLIALFIAMALPENGFFRLVAVSVIVANVLGYLAGLVVTHVFHLPNDGYFEYHEDDVVDEKNRPMG